MNGIAISVPHSKNIARRRLNAQSTTPFDHGRPIGRADSLPILLFVLVIAAAMIPLGGQRTHALLVDLPMPWPSDGSVNAPDRLIITVGLTGDGVATIDGRQVSPDVVAAKITNWQKSDTSPRIVFMPGADASYGDALALLRTLHRAGLVDWQFCFGGLPAHRDFGRTGADAPTGHRMPGISCDPARLYPPQRMPRIVQPKPKPPVDYHIW